MKQTHFIIAWMLIALAVSPSAAKILIIGPDLCAAPADAPIYRAPDDIAAGNQGSVRFLADGGLVVAVALNQGWARRRLFAWFDISQSDIERLPPALESARNCAGSPEPAP